MAGHARCAVTARAVGPGARPGKLSGCETRGMHPHDDTVRDRLGVGRVRLRQAGDTGPTIANGDGLYYRRFLVWVVVEPDRLVVSIRGSSDVRVAHAAAAPVITPGAGCAAFRRRLDEPQRC